MFENCCPALFAGLEEGKRLALGFFSILERLALTYILSTFPSDLVSLLTLSCFSTERKRAGLTAFPSKLLHVATTLYKHAHCHGDRSYMQLPVLFSPPSNASVIRKC